MNNQPASSGGYVPFPPFADWLPSQLPSGEFDSYREQYKNAKQVAPPGSVKAALETAMRYAAVDTNAIEGIFTTDRGLTRTIATKEIAWEESISQRGPQARPAFEDALAAYEWVHSSIESGDRISEYWIKKLHSIACASQDTYRVQTVDGPRDRALLKGAYKQYPNSPTRSDGSIHSYASELDTPPEMQRLINELNSELFHNANPAVQAAFAHYAYVCIHPFSDGNGRVARALASAYLYKSPGVPLVVFLDQRNHYLDALEAADQGDPTSFVQFIGARALDAVEIMRLAITRMSPPVVTTLTNLNKMFDLPSDLADMTAAGLRIKSLFHAELSRQFKLIDLPSQISGHTNIGEVAPPSPPHNYRPMGSSSNFYMTATSSWPVKVRLLRSFAVFSRSGTGASFDYIVASSDGDILGVGLSEIDPVETEALKLKAATWSENVIARFFAEFETKANAANRVLE